jgi:outer membrane protein OmpA-like peptidoglycan-associated protein
MSPGAYLTVVGHADTLGSAEHNIKLSKARADNTLRSIRDILGDKKFLIRNVFALGLGELLAGAESGFKTVPAPKHRRVELFLNGVLTLTLRAEGGP